MKHLQLGAICYCAFVRCWRCHTNISLLLVSPLGTKYYHTLVMALSKCHPGKRLVYNGRSEMWKQIPVGLFHPTRAWAWPPGGGEDAPPVRNSRDAPQKSWILKKTSEYLSKFAKIFIFSIISKIKWANSGEKSEFGVGAFGLPESAPPPPSELVSPIRNFVATPLHT